VAHCRRPPARYRAPAGRYQVVVGTLLHAPRLWEMALVTLPTSSGMLPGSPVLLPVAFGTFPVSSTLFPRPSCTLSFFHRRRASRRPAFLTRSRVALPNPGIPRNSVESPRRSEKYREVREVRESAPIEGSARPTGRPAPQAHWRGTRPRKHTAARRWRGGLFSWPRATRAAEGDQVNVRSAAGFRTDPHPPPRRQIRRERILRIRR